MNTQTNNNFRKGAIVVGGMQTMTNVPFVGKTYSLYGAGSNSDAYYEQLRMMIDECLTCTGTIEDLIDVVHKLSKNRRSLAKIARSTDNSDIASFLVHKLRTAFSQFTLSASEHLRNLRLSKRLDRTLSTTEEQYHLYMLEIGLRNRINSGTFRECDTRLAFLPHCLRDLTADCQSTKRGEDYVCKGCSKACNVNAVSKALRRHRVQPYIWMTANLSSLFKKLHKEGKHPGVLGIACIPELVSGMRVCAEAGVPAVGIPLDANRCGRWWGEFSPTR